MRSPQLELRNPSCNRTNNCRKEFRSQKNRQWLHVGSAEMEAKGGDEDPIFTRAFDT